MQDFKKLDVWRKAHALSLHVSRVAGQIRGQQHVSLRSQMARAASSIPTNTVEGRAMPGGREFARFIGYAIASTSELEYHLITAHDLDLLTPVDFRALTSQIVEVRKMLFGLLRRLRNDAQSPDRPADRSRHPFPKADS